MLFPTIIRIANLTSHWSDANGLYANNGSDTYTQITSGDAYSLGHDGARWILWDHDSNSVAYSEICLSTVSPMLATWGITAAIDHIQVYGDIFDTGVDFHWGPGGEGWHDEDGNYTMAWNADLSRWEITFEGEVYTYTLTSTTIDPWSVNTKDWYLSITDSIYDYEGGELPVPPVITNVTIAIDSADELQAINTNAFTRAGDYIQTGNITVSPTIANFTAIGTAAASFTGSYDGQNYTITNLVITQPTIDYQALFGYTLRAITGTAFQNIRLVNPQVSGKTGIASLFGMLRGDTPGIYVRNCHVTGAAITAANIVGSLFIGTGSIIGPTLTTIINFEDCSAVGTLTALVNSATALAAGFVGSGIVKCTRCSASGTITVHASSQTHGGFAGRSNSGTFTDCYARITLTGGATLKVGAFVGDLVNSYSQPTFVNCYGIVGGIDVFFGSKASTTPSVTSCYFEGTDGKNDNGAIGKTAAALKLAATFTDWVFETVWGIRSWWNDSYPILVSHLTAADAPTEAATLLVPTGLDVELNPDTLRATATWAGGAKTDFYDIYQALDVPSPSAVLVASIAHPTLTCTLECDWDTDYLWFIQSRNLAPAVATSAFTYFTTEIAPLTAYQVQIGTVSLTPVLRGSGVDITPQLQSAIYLNGAL
jgi:hypothetical protein